MGWTRWVAIIATTLALSGCVAGYTMIAASSGYPAPSRPHPTYYCYDCHADRFFDPYYDWCAYYGFRYSWAAHPQVVGIYRERYLRIKEQHPKYGRFRYRPDYRDSRRYRDPADYDAWRHGARSGPTGRGPSGSGTRIKEKRPEEPGKTKGRERTKPRGGRPRDSGREGV